MKYAEFCKDCANINPLNPRNAYCSNCEPVGVGTSDPLTPTGYVDKAKLIQQFHETKEKDDTV